MPDRDDQPPTRKTLPRVPGVPGLPLPPPREEPTRPDVPVARRAAPRPTLKGLPAPPSNETTLLSAPEHDPTPPSGQAPPPLHGRIPARQQTQAGLGDREAERQPQRQPASATATLKDFPPRSVSPVPQSLPAASVPNDVLVTRKGFRLNLTWEQVRSWLLVLGIFGVGGGVAGWYGGLKLRAAQMAAIEQRQEDEAKVLAKHGELLKSIAGKLDEAIDAAGQEAASNRKERATALERYRQIATDIEDVKKSMPRIEGLAKK